MQAKLVKIITPAVDGTTDSYQVSEPVPACPRCEQELAYYDGMNEPYLHCPVCNDYAYSIAAPYPVLGRIE